MKGWTWTRTIRSNGEKTIAATLVVDCLRPAEGGLKWLRRAGFGAGDPSADHATVHPLQHLRSSYDPRLGYSTFHFTITPALAERLPVPAGFYSCNTILCLIPDGRQRNAIYIIRFEGDTLQVCCNYRGDTERPTNLNGIKAFARNLVLDKPLPEWFPPLLDQLHEVEESATISHIRLPALSYVRYHQASNLPKNWIAVGDSVMRVNPEELDMSITALAPLAHDYHEEKSDDNTIYYCLALKVQMRRQVTSSATKRAEFHFISLFKSPRANYKLFKILFYTPSPSKSLRFLTLDPEVQHRRIPNEDSKELASNCSPKIFCNDKVAPRLKSFVKSSAQAPYSASSVLVGFTRLIPSSKSPFSFSLCPMLSTNDTSSPLITSPQEEPERATRRSSGKDPPSIQRHHLSTRTLICPVVSASHQQPSNTSTHRHLSRQEPGVLPQCLPQPSRSSEIETANTEAQDTKGLVTQQRTSKKVTMQTTLRLLALQMLTKLISLLSCALSDVNKLIASASSNLMLQPLRCRTLGFFHQTSLLSVHLQDSPSMTTQCIRDEDPPGRRGRSNKPINSVVIAASIKISGNLFEDLLAPKFGPFFKVFKPL